MKLRIQNDSLRLRLTVSEVRAIGAGEPVTGATHFPGGGRLTYALVPATAAGLTARLVEGTVRVEVARHEAAAWAADESRVSLQERVDLGNSGTLTLLVEKDFACLAPRPGEDGEDLFVNPRADS